MLDYLLTLQVYNCLTKSLVSEINERGNLEIKTGKLIFHSKNCHVYERQFKLVSQLVEPKANSNLRIAKTMQEKEEKTRFSS